MPLFYVKFLGFFCDNFLYPPPILSNEYFVLLKILCWCVIMLIFIAGFSNVNAFVLC